MALILLGLLAASALAVPVRADRILGTVSVEDPTTHLRGIDVTAGSTFSVNVWTRDVPEPGLVDFHFKIVWNSKLIDFVSRDVHDHGFGVLAEVIGSDSYEMELASPFPHSPLGGDASWVTLTFRCLGEGSSEIIIPYSHGYYGDYGHELEFTSKNAMINQEFASSSTGTVVTMAPWLVAFGLVVSVAVVAVALVSRKKPRS